MAPLENGLHRNELPLYRSRNSTASSGIFTLTPPLSPPEDANPSSSAALPPRAPVPVHINSTAMPQLITVSSRAPQTVNPYTTVSSGQNNISVFPPPPEYNHQSRPLDISSDPSSPVSPSFPPPCSIPGEEFMVYQWLGHEDLARPIFPGSRTGSSIATSDISSVREGMFGSLPSLPGGHATGETRRSAQDTASGPGSVSSRGTRDKENFSSYPSSRSGGSRPSSRWGGEEVAASVDGEMFPTSMPASPTIPYGTPFNYPTPAPPPAPTAPTSSNTSAINIRSPNFVFEGEHDSSARVILPDEPEPAMTRPPRYSATFAGPIGLDELINRDIAIGSQGVIPIQLKSEKEEKRTTLQGTKTVMLVQEDVWIEMTRLAGLAQQQGQNIGNAEGSGSRGYSSVDLEMGLQKASQGRTPKKRARKVHCCGTCIIS